MPQYGKRSHNNLSTCSGEIIHIFTNVIQEIDNSVIFGHRTPEKQFELYKKGRELIDGHWTQVDSVVTTKDGYNLLSYHNHYPSLAIDVVPYPGLYEADREQFYELAGVIKSTAKLLGYEIYWGQDLWGWDLAHWQLRE